MEALPVSPLADDLHDVSLAWDAGPLSRLSAIAASRRRGDRFLHRDPGKYRRHAGRHYFRPTLEYSRTPIQLDRGAGARAGRNSPLGLRQLSEDAGTGRLPYAGGRAGRLGYHP